MQYLNFGKFVRLKREALVPKTSLNKFAIDNNIDPATLSRIENLKQGVSLAILNKIAEGFNTVGSKLLNEYENSQFNK